MSVKHSVIGRRLAFALASIALMGVPSGGLAQQVGDAFVVFNVDTGEVRLNPGNAGITQGSGVIAYGIRPDPAVVQFSTAAADFSFLSGSYALFAPTLGNVTVGDDNTIGAAFYTLGSPNVNTTADSFNHDNMVLGTAAQAGTGGSSGISWGPGNGGVVASKIAGSYLGTPEWSFGTIGSTGMSLQDALAAFGATTQGGLSSSPGMAYSIGGLLGTQNFRVYTVMEPVSPVKITGVYVKGSGWNANYLARSPFANVEGATVGWELPDGEAQLANASNVAWNNVDTITVEFDQPISQPEAAALQLLRGTTEGNQTIVPTLAPTLLGDGSAAQWRLPADFTTLEKGKYVISIAAEGIENAAGTTILDGDWVTGVSTFAEGSGDGQAGGAFNFFFNSLVGDVNANGTMNALDISAIRNDLTSPLNTPLAPDSSNYRLDINGSNGLNSADLSQTRAQLTSALGTTLASLPAVTLPVATGGDASIAAVPEPGLGLVALAAAALALRRRNRS
jgi:hypothetical protein